METERLILRRFRQSDFGDFALLIRDKINGEFSAYDEQFPTDDPSLKNILAYFCSTDEFFAVEKKDDGRVIGFVCLNPADAGACNLGYCIHSAFRRRGYAAEAVREMTRYAKEQLKLEKLISGTAEENVPSVRLLSRLGFQAVRRERGSFTNDDQGNPIVFNGCTYELIL